MTRRPSSLSPHGTRPPFTIVFSYYGSKSKLAHLYPAPKHDRIIEPFAGAAAYSCRHWDKEVLLYDADPITAEIWRFLLSPTCRAWLGRIPPTVTAGQLVTDVLPPDSPIGLIRFCQATGSVGTQGATGIHNTITKFGVRPWSRLPDKMRYWLPRISHWRFQEADYREVPNQVATWFIDPPYANEAGMRYRTQIKNDGDDPYLALGDWCRERQGQVIACENYGATWLPFLPLVPRRGVQSSYQVSKAMEAYYEQGATAC